MPELRGLEADDEEVEDMPPGGGQGGALDAFYDGPDEDAPPDAVGAAVLGWELKQQRPHSR